MFEFNEKQYELKFNIQRVKLIEATIKGSLIGQWQASSGMLPLQTIETCFQFALKEVGADSFVSQTEAVKIGNALMEERGYAMAALFIQEALQECMPFLFRAS